jgi:hypothetical protein
VPKKGSSDMTNFWPFAWGSQQFDVPAGHTRLQLVWNEGAAAQKEKRGEAVAAPVTKMRRGRKMVN